MTRRSTRRRTRTARAARPAAALLTALALAACGGGTSSDGARSTASPTATSTPSGSPAPTATSAPSAGTSAPGTPAPTGDAAAALRTAAESTTRSGSSRVSLVSTVTAQGQTLRIEGSGVMDYAKRVGEMTTRVTGPRSATFRQVITPTAMYITGVPNVPRGKWLKVDLTKLGADAGNVYGNDPTAALEYLRGAADLRVTGTADVRGERTTRYVGTLDLARAAGSASPQTRARIQRELAQAGVGKVPFEAYVDAQQRLRRMVMRMTLQSQGQRVTSVTSVDTYDFGVPVRVDVPSGAQVYTPGA